MDITWLTLGRVASDVTRHELRTRRVPTHLTQVYGGEPIPTDAWSTEIVLEPAPQPWDLVSRGADGLEGGVGFATDLRYSERPH